MYWFVENLWYMAIPNERERYDYIDMLDIRQNIYIYIYIYIYDKCTNCIDICEVTDISDYVALRYRYI